MAFINYGTVKLLLKEQTGYSLCNLKVNETPISTELIYVFRNKYYRQYIKADNEQSVVDQIKLNISSHGGKFKNE